MQLGPQEWTAGAEVRLMDSLPGRSLLRIVIGEGRKRQIRRQSEAIGHPVRRLVRVRVGAISLGDLRPGEWRHLTWEEINRTAGGSAPATRRPA
jgi:pseudouridine synthase